MDFNEQDASIYPNGTIIAERYEITSFLAQGGMAQVYVAKQQQIDRPVALKVLSPAFSMNSGVVMRFFREAHVVGRLQHPNTIHIFDMGETPDNRLFIAMELLDGEELSERIKRGPIPVADMFQIVKQVAGSLSEAHQMGVIHRDLKPDNIFLTKLNVVKVLDFGIAKLNSEDEVEKQEKRLTKAGTAPGTPEYMSPEQARGKDLDARSDLYSLGIVMYEMLCGHPPFEESTYLGTVLLQVQATPPPLPDTIPAPLSEYIIQRMLAKDPNGRPASAEVFIQELDELAVKLKLVKDEKEEEEQLSKAKAEIELLKSQLAQTKLELLRSGDCNVLSESVIAAGAPSLELPKIDSPASIKLDSSPNAFAPGSSSPGLPKLPMTPGVTPPSMAQGMPSMGPASMMGQTTRPGAMPTMPSAGPAALQQPMRSGVMPTMQQPGPAALQQPMRPGAMPAMQQPGPAAMQNMQSGVMPAMQNMGPMGMQNMQSGVMPVMQQVGPAGMQPMQPMQSGVMPVMQNMGPMSMQPMQSGVMPVMQQVGPAGMQNMQPMQSGVMPVMQQVGPAGMQPMQSGVMPVMQQGQGNMPGAYNQGAPAPRQRQMPGMPSQGGRAYGSGHHQPEEPPIPQTSGNRMPAPPQANRSYANMQPADGMNAAPQSSGSRMPAPPQANRSHSNLHPVDDMDEEPVIAPMPRHKVSYGADNRMSDRSDEYRETPSSRHRAERYASFDLDAESASSRPKDTFSGSVAKKGSASTNREMTFMMYAQPLCSKMGPEKTNEALDLAKSVWNATIMGRDALHVLFDSAKGRVNLTKLIQLMASRKETYFPNENWIIEDLGAHMDPSGRLELNLLTTV